MLPRENSRRFVGKIWRYQRWRTGDLCWSRGVFSLVRPVGVVGGAIHRRHIAAAASHRQWLITVTRGRGFQAARLSQWQALEAVREGRIRAAWAPRNGTSNRPRVGSATATRCWPALWVESTPAASLPFLFVRASRPRVNCRSLNRLDRRPSEGRPRCSFAAQLRARARRLESASQWMTATPLRQIPNLHCARPSCSRRRTCASS